MNVILLSVVRPMVAYNIYAFFHSFISIYSFKLKLIYLDGNGKFYSIRCFSLLIT